MLIALLKISISIYIMWKVSSSFDLAANYLTRNIGEGIKGPTINAIASSLPELIISSMFLFYYGDIKGFSAGYATIIGSSAFNIACIPIISFLALYYRDKKIKFEINKKVVFEDSIFLLASIIILSLGFIIGVNQYLSLLLIGLYCIYIYKVYSNRKSDKLNTTINLTEEYDEKFTKGNSSYLNSLLNLRLFNLLFLKKVNTNSSLLVVLISVILIGSSCWFLIEVVDTISTVYNIDLFISAFFIAAIASSIPDTILSMKDAKHGKFIDSFSNSYGSNIFDICIGIGLPVLVYSILYNPIEMKIPIDRIALLDLGNILLQGNLLLWSIIILFTATFLISIIYYFGKINFKNSMLILFIYLLFIFSLIIF